MDISFPIKRRSKSADRQSARQSLNQSDSGVSTVRDSCEPDENWDMSPHSPGNRHESDEGDDEEDDGRDTQKSSRRDSRTPSRMSRTSSVQSPSLDKVSKLESKNSSGVSFRMKSCASQDSLLDPETFPRRKISDIKKQLGIEDKPANWTHSWSPNPRKCSTPKEKLSPDGTPEKGIMPPTPLPRTKMITSTIDNKDKEETDRTEASNSELNNNSVEESDYEYEPTGPAEQTFKVIFVGDAGVGKSSFALRISKGVFVRHMSSTLGIDFLMRTIRVDGRNVAVQLWDTAGQERFRSITKSYFRKADGVMLLYDCTCEHSFLNVRQWVEDIDVSCFYSMMAEKTPSGRKASSQRIPLMIVANKIDLRDMAVRTGVTCISTEEGEKLAKDCDTTFMEASAKDGSNVLHALANLVRSMRTQQELQLSASTMQLCDKKAKKSGSCCGK
ncbi:ras and EF-hand domain-containing protein-like [Stegodyphus dumicola]|uniref:ras and EF-hand domain-containing protein-like n=1 Tax=Stegodyphus dumicola TaxID=202533 RepID=UPI0015AF1174|nr:ras and EF-hand domain-containing protein-like [Stegodyphus dumicola]